MTASMFPCRAQLIGLPPTAVEPMWERTPPPVASVQRVSRNLFGAPSQGEIAQLLEDENERQRHYVLGRYNFDIKIGAPVAEAVAATAAAAAGEAEAEALKCRPVCRAATTTLEQNGDALPSRIVLEMLEHEQRLQAGNLSRAEVTPPSCAAKRQAAQIRRTTASSANSSSSSNDDQAPSERLKPYARQTLLTDCFNLRKTPQFNGRTAMPPANTRSPSQRRLEVLQLPKPMRVVAAVDDSVSLDSSAPCDHSLTANEQATSATAAALSSSSHSQA